jgi:hypothetical protein
VQLGPPKINRITGEEKELLMCQVAAKDTYELLEEN